MFISLGHNFNVQFSAGGIVMFNNDEFVEWFETMDKAIEHFENQIEPFIEEED
jgi:hypothetical protein